MDINTCYETTSFYHTIAYYSHLVPVALALFLSVYALFKTRASKLAITFFAFTLGFSTWLIGDLVTWTSQNYYAIYFTWSWLDFVNIVFFVLGAYFFGVLSKGSLATWEKWALILITVPAFVITITGNSLFEFDQTWCEAVENEGLTIYKVFAEAATVAIMLFSYFASWKKSDVKKRTQLSIVLGAVVLFFAVFASTEYIATITNVYETNLYGLFILPLFLIIMVFAITNLGVFQFRFLGTQVLAYALIIMSGSQFLFLQDSAESTLSIITLVISIFFGILLLQNARREAEARTRIEQLAHDLQAANVKLRDLDKQKTEFVSFATHQIRSPLTSIKGNAAMILEGDYGPINDQLKGAVNVMLTSIKTLGNVVEDYLNISRIELGTMRYDMKVMDFKELVAEVMNEQKTNIEAKGLKHSVSIDESQTYRIKADPDKFKQVLMNTVDNSTKYTKEGSIEVSLEKTARGTIRFAVKDTGVGIDPAVMPKLFQKFSRAKNANEANIHGTGLGLFIAKEIVAAHGGRMWAESEGEGKGSQFYVEVPEAR